MAAAIRDDPPAAVRPTGPHGWSPLFYLAYGRLETSEADTLDCARQLLAAGADPNEGRFFAGLPTPFTVLTGVLGGGERDQPPHPQAIALATLLLEAGADPNDAQTLYNRQFEPEDDFLALLLAHGLGRESPSTWAELLPDLTESPTELVRGLLAWAVLHDQRDRVSLLAAAGVDLVSPLSSPYLPRRGTGQGHTPIELALLSGHPVLARQLAGETSGLSAAVTESEPEFSDVEAVLVAVMTADRGRLAGFPESIRQRARTSWPGLVVWAASQGGPAAVTAAVEAGFGIDALGRSDVLLDQPWQTALHTAVERNDPGLISLLLDLGADPGIQDARFGATPADWADHFGRPELKRLLERTPEGDPGRD